MGVADYFSPFLRRYSFLILPIVFGVVVILPVFATTTDDIDPDLDSATTTTLVTGEEQEDLPEPPAEEGATNTEQIEEQQTPVVVPDVTLGNVTSTPTTTESDTSTQPIKDKDLKDKKEEEKIEPTKEKETKEDIKETKEKEEEKKEKPEEEPPIVKGEIRLRVGEVKNTQEKMEDVEQEEMSEETFFEEDESESFVPADYIAEPASVARAIKREISLETNPTHSCKADPFSVDISNEGAVDAVLTFLGRGGSSYEVEIGELPSGISVSIDGVETKYKTVSNKTTSLPLTFYSTGDVQTGSFSVSVLYIKDGKSISVCQLNLVNS